MDAQELQTYVAKISLTVFKRPFVHQTHFNQRLRTTGGRYRLGDHGLEFNPRMADLPEFAGIVKHELVHYHLHLQGRGYRHRDADFKQLLKQIGGSRYAPDIGLRQHSQHCWHYRCQNGHDIYRQRRFNTQRYCCGRCHTALRLLNG